MPKDIYHSPYTTRLYNDETIEMINESDDINLKADTIVDEPESDEVKDDE